MFDNMWKDFLTGQSSTAANATTTVVSGKNSSLYYGLYLVSGLTLCNVFGLLRGREGKKSSQLNLVLLL